MSDEIKAAMEQCVADPDCCNELDRRLSALGPAPPPPSVAPSQFPEVQGHLRGRVGAGGWASWAPFILSVAVQVLEEFRKKQSAETQPESRPEE